jgi:hypothetical protein
MHRAAYLGVGLVCVSAVFGVSACKGSSSSSGGGATSATSASASASATASATAEPSAAAKPVTAAPAGPPPVFVAGETWSGSFHCVRGQFTMSLHITRSQPDVGAELSFTSPQGLSGAYMVNGVYNAAAHHLHLAPGNWIHQPEPSFQSMPLDGEVTADGRGFSGVVESSRCSGFGARR